MNDDLISRQDAVSRMSDLICELKSERLPTWDEVYNAMLDLPSVQPTQKTGRWIEHIDERGDTYYECSNCKEAFTLIEGTLTDNLYNYCPNCGSYNEGKNDKL